MFISKEAFTSVTNMPHSHWRRRALRRASRFALRAPLMFFGLLAAAEGVAAPITSDLALSATLEPPAPWAPNQRVTLTMTARNLRQTPAVGQLYASQPRRPDFMGGGPMLGGSLPSSTCQSDILCSEFQEECWSVGALQGFGSRTCRIDFQVPSDAQSLSGLIRVRLTADPVDLMTVDNEVSLAARTQAPVAVPAASPLILFMFGALVALLALRRLG